MDEFDRTELNFLSLNSRKNKTSIEKILVNPDSKSFENEFMPDIEQISEAIVEARNRERPVILAFGAHLIKNGLVSVLERLIQEKFVTHLATNGAGSIHDWEFAYQGKTEEDVRENIAEGKFGLWEETGRFINLALIAGAYSGIGYGESIGKMIQEDKIVIPSDLRNPKLEKIGISHREISVNHPFKQYSIQNAAFSAKIPFTVHPCFGQDIIYSHPLSDGASIGKAAEKDFLKFASSVSELEGGMYLSVGSAIMSPMIFEKSLSMARNLAIQKGENIKDFMIVVNDIQEAGNWNWKSKDEPSKNDPSYYLRFCKSFSRMGAKDIKYVQLDNRKFLLNLYHNLRSG